MFHDNKQVFSETHYSQPREERLTVASSDPTQDGIREVKAVFEPSNQSLPKSSKIAYLSTDRQEKVLLFSGSPEDARLLQQAFSGQAYDLLSIFPD